MTFRLSFLFPGPDALGPAQLTTRGGWTRVIWRHVNINFADTAIPSPLNMYANVAPSTNRQNLEAKFCKGEEPLHTPTEKQFTGCNT